MEVWLNCAMMLMTPDRANGGIVRSFFMSDYGSASNVEDKGTYMNCYRCLTSPENCVRAAVAVCQHCGSGMCEHHLVTLTRPPAAGMNGALTPRMMCSHCFHTLFPPKPQHHANRTHTKGSWIERLARRGKQYDGAKQELPAPSEAVALIESFLKQQKT
jgi:hypothetical protein